MTKFFNQALNVFLAALVLLVILASTAHAKASYGTVVSPAPNGFNIKFAKDGTPLAVPANSATGVTMAVPATVNLTPVLTMQVATTAVIAGAQFGGPWGAAIATVGVVAVMSIPVFQSVYDAAKVRVNPTTGALEKADPAACTVAPCYQYRIDGSASGVPSTDWMQSAAAASASFVASYNAVTTCGPTRGDNNLEYVSNTETSVTVKVITLAQGTCAVTVGNTTSYTIARRSVAPSSAVWIPATVSEAQAAVSAQVPTVAQVDALADLGFQPDTGPVTITGPAEVAGMNTVKLLADGSQRTEACKYYLEYFPSNIKAHPECTATTVTPEKTETHTETVTGPDGLPITKTVTTTTPGKTTTEVTTPDKLPDPVTCGLPGGSPCKIDEAGTPSSVADTQFSSKLDTLKVDQDAHVVKVGGTADKSFFGGWSSLFITPPLAACTVYELPSRNGVSMGSLDPCPVVDGVRAVMNYLWAFGGFWLCLGWIREVI